MSNPAQIASRPSDRSTERAVQGLIAEYQAAARSAVVALREVSHSSDLIRDWRSGRLKASGTLQQPRGQYRFHGVGCRFEIGGRTVDVDFGPAGRYDGFDAWRLQQFAESGQGGSSLNVAAIERGLAALASAGIITRSGADPAPHLYYLSSAAAQSD
ncbi:MAG TPA: hypothetical protein VG269_07930 [Tepidisphaeraceae bacterium]|nr:hypothetical protein [Tepidisphaeraceae bacterium]